MQFSLALEALTSNGLNKGNPCQHEYYVGIHTYSGEVVTRLHNF